jgi:hypothetical protein
MGAAASAVTLVGSVNGTISALGSGPDSHRARTEAPRTDAPRTPPPAPVPGPLTAPPSKPVTGKPAPGFRERGTNPHPDQGKTADRPRARRLRVHQQIADGAALCHRSRTAHVRNARTPVGEIAHDRQVLGALGGPAGLGAVIDTGRNGDGAPPDGQWYDPGHGRGPDRRLPAGEAAGGVHGCRGTAGTFTPSYAYDLAR